MPQQRLYDDRNKKKEKKNTEKNENGNLRWAKPKQKKQENELSREWEREITTTAQSINNMEFGSCNVFISAIATHIISCGPRA